MGHPAGRKEEGRARVLAAAGRGFRAQGYGGIGVDGLARAAGVTSGAFYAHFASKAAAFRAAVVAGMQDLRAGLAALRATGEGWRARFIGLYLDDRRTCDLAESCALQSLTGEVARADPETRAAYEAELQAVIAELAAGLEGGAEDGTDPGRRARATALLALLAGGVSMARAVRDPALAEEIAAAVRAAALRLEG
ncbi:TetR/AcrR family transcriptional regulator [Paracraurococcus ruber]|uniref:TetR family transcriptional regulator n=1 Tax=Paracraurococcus ruber TaxID=77675 RepID=A0ABS1D961_9PROT|nr:TetR/AcrR family transcriptional regulator [Paracraurococcus ruber]MBK1662419.1 TetR family transcriptional regulator [Paracraurococcus ruber]TDG28638.1 TetR/AcrR family transcriptional regulator [Paracraurococcus ruber]